MSIKYLIFPCFSCHDYTGITPTFEWFSTLFMLYKLFASKGIYRMVQTKSEQVGLFAIAVRMKESGYSDAFVVDAVRVALEFEGVADLIHLWANESDKNERDTIIADIQNMILVCRIK